MTGGHTAIDMAVGGTNATVDEKACTTSFVNGVCTPGTLLGSITLFSGSGDQYVYQTLAGAPPAISPCTSLRISMWRPVEHSATS